jgi:hypothetical protein
MPSAAAEGGQARPAVQPSSHVQPNIIDVVFYWIVRGGVHSSIIPRNPHLKSSNTRETGACARSCPAAVQPCCPFDEIKCHDCHDRFDYYHCHDSAITRWRRSWRSWRRPWVALPRTCRDLGPRTLLSRDARIACGRNCRFLKTPRDRYRSVLAGEDPSAPG